MPATTIYCRCCHHRLLDIEPGARGSIRIKCSRCRRIIRISFFEPQKNKDYLAKE